MIRRTILFDNKCGFVLGENPKAPNPYVTWQFNEQDGHRDFFWGHYHNEPDMRNGICITGPRTISGAIMCLK